MIRPPIPPQQRLHEVTATPKITPKEITWDRMGLSNDPQSVLASNGKEKVITVLSFMMEIHRSVQITD